MRSHREIELKWILEPGEHARLAAAVGVRLGPPTTLAQRNRFFDAADGRLRRAGMNVRLRHEGHRLLLTCKRRGAAPASGLFDHEEWERDLDPGLWDSACAAQPGLARALRLPPPLLAVLADAELAAVGGFDNQRLEWHDGDELVCLDRTDFAGGGIDHELEVETPRPDASRARWRALLAGLGIPDRPQTETKFARFLARRK